MTLYVGLPGNSHTEAIRLEEILMKVNPRFAQAMAIAKAIPHRKNTRAVILKWCEVAKAAIGCASGFVGEKP